MAEVTKHHALKEDPKPITVIMRQYYNTPAGLERKAKQADRYRTDPVFRQMKIDRAKEQYRQKKLKALESKCLETESSSTT
jgi:hypothetical protein